MEKIPVSVIILTKDSEKHIKQVLEQLKEFYEVLIIDNGSTDNTLLIAKEFNNVKIFKEKFIGFGPLRNKAINYAKYDWILFIDSDEIVTSNMKEKIKKIDFTKMNYIYAFLRKNYYKNKLINCCGWEKDYVKRLFNRNHTNYSNKKVHEDIIEKRTSKVVYIKDGLNHYAYDGVDKLIDKMQYYSTLWSLENKKCCCLVRGIFSSIFKFIKNYFLEKGIFYGYEGFIISVCNSLGVFFKYIKLYEREKYEN